MNKKRGRPPNSSKPRVAQADVTIGRSVHSLMFWGFPLRKTCEAVARAARTALQRHDSHNLPLSGDRIEQIYEKWKKGRDFKIERKRFVAKGLYQRCPDKTASIEELALELLKNEGNWRNQELSRFKSEINQEWFEPVGILPDEWELTTKARRDVENARVRLVFSKWGN